MIHKAGCVICGKELVYEVTSELHTCSLCGRQQESNVYCPEGHFVCDDCHRNDALGMIETITVNSKTINPIKMAQEIMSLPSVHVHGPEHHSLVPAVLLASVRNLGLKIEASQITEAIRRSAQVPGGICGNWGTCGAGIGSGIGFSVLRGLTPLIKEGWGETNREVGEVLQRIGAYGGPRCCKRSTYSALLAAVEILERDGVVKFPAEVHSLPVCKDFWRNEQCLKEQCPYYPRRKEIS